VIAKITRGSGFGGVVRYVLDERKGLVPDHQPEMIGGNMAGRTSAELVREFSAVRWLRPDVQKPVEHVSVSFGKDERPISNDEMARLADEYLRRRGVHLERVQYVVVRHRDKGHQHCHLVLNRVRTDLKLVPQAFRDYVRSKEICRTLERDFGLKPARSDRTPGRLHEWAPSRGEERMKRDRGIESVKERLKALIRGAARGQPTMTAFVNRLEAEGVQARANVSATTGHVSGISFRLEGVAVKGSKLGHGYSFLGLQRDQGVRYDAGRDLTALERVTRLTAGQEPLRGLGRIPAGLLTRGAGRVPALALMRTLQGLAHDLNRGQFPARALMRLAVSLALPPQTRAALGIVRTLRNLSRSR
jgi:hypothetical protein